VKKICKFRLGILIALLGSVVFGLCIGFNGNLALKDFPLQELWSSELDGEVKALSDNGDQIIFARTSKKLFALDKESGNILWQHDLVWQGIPKPPITSNGLVYLADGKAIWAFDQENGSVKWTMEVPLASASVEIISANVVVVKMSSYVFVLDAIDGTILWNKPECRYGDFPVYIENSYLYSPCLDNITTMNINNGEVVSDVQEPLVIAKVAYRDATMYYSPDRNSISALDLKTLSVLWESGFTGKGFREFRILGNYLVVTGSDKFCVFERETGNQLWCSDFNNPQNPVIIDNMLLLFDGFQNHISAFDIMTGNKLGDLSIKRINMFSVERELMVSIDNLLVFGNGSSVFALGKEEVDTVLKVKR
jgi:outer membrane protein assembly factor BamB